MMRLTALVMLTLISQSLMAADCSAIKPFKFIGVQKVHISVARLFWAGSIQHDKDICSGDIQISTYDVRGREEDAYNCLKPKDSEVLTCKTVLNGSVAEIAVIPASWIRSWKPKHKREYRFHSYITKSENPKIYLDIFSRSLSSSLVAQSLILEGALKSGPENQSDGYFVRTEFKK